MRRWLRLMLLATVLVALAVTARVTGLTDELTVESLRARVADTGAAGVVLFLAAFAGGNLVQIPGLVFVTVASLCWPGLQAVLLAFVGAVAAVSTSFLVFRTLGGTPLADVERPWVRRMLDRLDEAPVQTIALLRLVLLMAPPVNAALALSGVSFRSYLLGSALGLVVPIAALAGGLVTLF
ncbi:MAG: TVP38/TMEM64 family protein [Myxococcota bacterium]